MISEIRLPDHGHSFGLVGAGVTVVTPCWVQGDAGLIRLEDGAWISGCCFFLANAPIDVGPNVMIGPGVHFYAGEHSLHVDESTHGQHRREMAAAPITVEEDAWIGGRAVVLPGLTIGAHAVVGAGAVVTTNVPPYALVAGVPATVIRELPR